MIRLTSCLRISRTMLRKEALDSHADAMKKSANAYKYTFSGLSVCLQNQLTRNCSIGTSALASQYVSACRRAGVKGFLGDNRIVGPSLGNSIQLFDHRIRQFSSSPVSRKKEEITVNFLNRDGETITVKARVGDTFLDTVIDNDVDIDGFGACEGTLACSTCHLVFDEEIFDTLPEKLDEEEDMLDLAYGLEDTSRLGCQIQLTKDMDDIVVRVPEGINDARDV